MSVSDDLFEAVDSMDEWFLIRSYSSEIRALREIMNAARIRLDGGSQVPTAKEMKALNTLINGARRRQSTEHSQPETASVEADIRRPASECAAPLTDEQKRLVDAFVRVYDLGLRGSAEGMSAADWTDIAADAERAVRACNMLFASVSPAPHREALRKAVFDHTGLYSGDELDAALFSLGLMLNELVPLRHRYVAALNVKKETSPLWGKADFDDMENFFPDEARIDFDLWQSLYSLT